MAENVGQISSKWVAEVCNWVIVMLILWGRSLCGYDENQSFHAGLPPCHVL